MTKAIYPGTFDPVTVGHFDIVKRALKIFDEVVIAVALSSEKKPMFDAGTRVRLMQACFEDEPRVSVKMFDCLLVDFAKNEQTNIIIRGLRAISDFEYELQMGYANRSLYEDVETIYLMSSLEYAFVSSSVVRAIFRHNGKVDHLLPVKALSMLNDGGACVFGT